ncbi:MAG: SagB/ThcOx family dehydrogenase [Desulfurococcaceae archaeon]
MVKPATLFYLVSLLLTVYIVIHTLTLAFYPQYIYTGERAITKEEKPSEEDRIALTETDEIYLPLPRKISNLTVEEAILFRRSIRRYTEEPVKLLDLAMILWAAYGITETRHGLRASPSAGATYPLEIYVVIGANGVYDEKIGFLTPGIYRYDVFKHSLLFLKEGDFRDELCDAALGQEWVRNAPVNIVITAIYERTTRRYGERGRERYVPMEVGHVGQNIYLMATALGYGTVAIGAFIDGRVAELLDIDVGEVPLYIMPIGVPAEPYRITFEDIGDFILSKRG